MLSFKEYLEITGYESGHLELDESRMGKSNWVKSVAIGLQVRIRNQLKAIKSAKTVDEKLDRMGDLMLSVSYLSTLSIATDLGDKSIMKGKKR
ncbi:hypothetical protein JCM17960_34740 [Magnetospira thiophila]